MPLSKFGSKKKPEPVVESTPKIVETPEKRDRTYLHVEVGAERMKRIKRLALDEECNLTQLVLRGLDLILKERGLPPL
jgi:hypothetical protein